MTNCREMNKSLGRIVQIVWEDSTGKPHADTLFRVVKCKSSQVTLQIMLSLEAQADEAAVQVTTMQISWVKPVGPQYPGIRPIVGF